MSNGNMKDDKMSNADKPAGERQQGGGQHDMQKGGQQGGGQSPGGQARQGTPDREQAKNDPNQKGGKA
jgi:hypothetical protein